MSPSGSSDAIESTEIQVTGQETGGESAIAPMFNTLSEDATNEESITTCDGNR